MIIQNERGRMALRLAFLIGAGCVCLVAPVRAAERSPVAAGVLSAALPGAGQVYDGDTVRGLEFFGGESLLVAATTASVVHDTLGNLFHGNGGASGTTTALVVASIGVYIWNIGDAVATAQAHHRGTSGPPGALLFQARSEFRWKLDFALGKNHPAPLPRLCYGFRF